MTNNTRIYTPEEQAIINEYNRIWSVKTPHYGAHEVEIEIQYNMIMTGCSRLEADVWFDLECEDIEDTRKTIAQLVTYYRRHNDKEFMQEHINYFINNVYPRKYKIKNATADEVIDDVKEDIYTSVYHDEWVDDYSEMTEDEIKKAINADI